MSSRSKLALINLPIWTISFIVCTIVFIQDTQYSKFPMQNYRGTTSMIFALTNIPNVIILYFMFRKERTDERNKRFNVVSRITNDLEECRI